jgi:hypothetical protein
MGRRTLCLVAGATLLAVTPRPARACPGEGAILAILAAGILVPSELGSEVTSGAGGNVAPVIGWAYQVPLDHFLRESRHRLALAVDWTPGGAGVDARARVGYRYVRGPLELGLGVSTGPDRIRLSPELGVGLGKVGGDFGLHLRLRAEAAPTSPRDVRGVVTLGWSIL